jgi:hypothetical protein
MVYVVVDTKGAGRIVGVFDDESRAQAIRQIDTGYFRVIAMEPNAVNPIAIDWLPTQAQRDALKTA